MKNLKAALREINRGPSAAGGFPYVAYIFPWEYARWDRDLFRAYDIGPMKYLQEEFAFEYCYEPETTRTVRIKGRSVETGTIANRIIESAIARKMSRALDNLLSDKSWAYRPGRNTQMAAMEVRDQIRRGCHFAAKMDVENFFPSIDRRRLEWVLRSVVADDRALRDGTSCELPG